MRFSVLHRKLQQVDDFPAWPKLQPQSTRAWLPCLHAHRVHNSFTCLHPGPSSIPHESIYIGAARTIRTPHGTTAKIGMYFHSLAPEMDPLSYLPERIRVEYPCQSPLSENPPDADGDGISNNYLKDTSLARLAPLDIRGERKDWISYMYHWRL